MSSCEKSCGCGSVAAPAEAASAPSTEGTWVSIFSVPKMDCPSEERMIRLALNGLPELRSLSFDLSNRQVSAFHDGAVDPLSAKLESLGLGAELLGTQPASQEAASANSASETLTASKEASTLKVLLGINAAMFVIEMGAGLIAQSTGLIADSLDMFADDQLPCTDEGIEDGKPFQLGSITLEPIHTPGHTDGHFAYRLGDRVFTGDALLIEGCGRTDFQNGDSDSLYRSVHERLFTLPDDCLVYPAHDYKKRRVSTIAQEKDRNGRLGNGKTLEEFRKIMQELDLPYPKFIDYAVPGNRQCGACPDNLPEQLQEYCRQMEQSPQG